MRFILILSVALLTPQLLLLAQDSYFPTLDELEDLRVPSFDYAAMIGRMSRMNPEHIPPESPPVYAIGDRETFRISFRDGGADLPTEMELRGQSPRVLIWIQASLDYPNWRANALAQSIERNVLNPMQKLFQFSEPPGVDGDPRLTVALVSTPEGHSQGYFSRNYARPRRLYSRSNQREMVIVSLLRDDEYDFYDEILLGIIAHEYVHVLHFHTDAGEENWLNEGLATFAGFRAAKPFLSRSSEHAAADSFLESPGVGLTQWRSVDEKGPKYGAGFLFIMYLVQRFGDNIAARLLAEPADGWRAITRALPEFTDISADEAFADWVLANYFLDVRRGYGYRELDADLTPPQPVHGLNSFPATYESELPQYATDYISVDVRGADKLLLRLGQEPEAQLVAAYNDADRGTFAYALASDYGYARLTRAFNLDTSQRQIWLEFRLWHDLVKASEYAFVTLSADGGNTWNTLRGRHTELSGIYDEYYTLGYTGATRFWRHERIDLSRYRQSKVLISFELVSNVDTNYRGAGIDDVRIRAIDFHEDFESPDDAWIAEGWIRTDNRLPNNTWLQVVQDTGDQLHVSRERFTGAGELTVDLLPGVSQALIAVSPVTPQTALPTEYTLEASLLDAAGNVMVVSRACSLTTTDPLNFRAAPGGNKIGLLLKGTVVDGLDRDGDWFQVDHNGALGWVHGDYVTQAGKCP